MVKTFGAPRECAAFSWGPNILTNCPVANPPPPPPPPPPPLSVALPVVFIAVTTSPVTSTVIEAKTQLE